MSLKCEIWISNLARQIKVALSIIRIRQNRIWSRFIWKMWPTLSVHVCTFWVFYDTRLLSSGPSVPQVWDDVWVLQKSQIYDAQFEMWKSSLKLPKSVDMHKIIMYFTKNLDPSQSHEEKNSQCNKIVFCIHTFIAELGIS